MGETQPTLFPLDFNRSIVIEDRPERLTGDAGVLALRQIDHRLGLTDWLAARLTDPRDADLITHPQVELLRTRLYLIAQGHRYDLDGNLIEAFVAADMNCDGTVNNFDVDAFVLALTNPAAYAAQYPTCDPLNGDMNGDGLLNSLDIDAFVAYLTGHAGATGMRAEYAWDAENRLTSVTPTAPQAGDKKLVFAYDYLGRRIEKQVFDWDDQAADWQATPSVQRKFVWGGTDAGGWLMLMELDGNDSIVRKYTWGLDLAGQSGSGNSLADAGGIGGLLAVAQAQVGGGSASGGVDAGDYVFTCDASGNVAQVLDLSADSAAAAIVAHYEYDPYGGVVNDLSGYTYAEANPIRFSTKYHDAETGLGYWGYRYYSARLGRWLSRDPIGEAGGALLYAYVGNGPTNRYDRLGLNWCDGPVSADTKKYRVVGPFHTREDHELDILGLKIKWHSTTPNWIDAEVGYEILVQTRISVKIVGPTVQGDGDEADIFIGATLGWKPPSPHQLVGYSVDSTGQRSSLAGVACRVCERCKRECSRCTTEYFLGEPATTYTQVGCVFSKGCHYRYGTLASDGWGYRYCSLLAQGQGLQIQGRGIVRQPAPLQCDESSVPKCNKGGVQRCSPKDTRWKPR